MFRKRARRWLASFAPRTPRTVVRRRPTLSVLEDRTVPASVAGAPIDLNQIAGMVADGHPQRTTPLTPTVSPSAPKYQPTDFYVAGGKSVQLSRLDDRLVVALPGGTAELSRRTADAADPLFGYEPLTRLAGGEAFILRSPTRTGALKVVSQLEGKIVGGWVSPLLTTLDGATWLAPTNEVIVQLHNSADAPAIFNGQDYVGYRRMAGSPDTFVVQVKGGSGRAALNASHAMYLDDRIEWAEPNFYQSWKTLFDPNDTLFGMQYHLKNTVQVPGYVANADIDAPTAWNTTKGSGQVIAVLDQGIEITHPDLAANVFVNAGEIAGNLIDDDGNGWVDDVSGWNFFNDDNASYAQLPGETHGTATSGLAAAVGNNALGVAGVAYEAKILPMRIADDVSFTNDANIASALYYAAGRNQSGIGTWSAGTVLSNSWGGGAPSAAIEGAVDWAGANGRGGKGTPIAWSAGNGGGVIYPSTLATTKSNVISVGGSSPRDNASGYSTGPELTLVAPTDDFYSVGATGTGIVTTDRTGADGYNNAGDYTDTPASAFGGTSSSAPITAGSAALVLAAAPSLTAAQLRSYLQNTTDTIQGQLGGYDAKTGHSDTYGSGRVDAGAAVTGVGAKKVNVLLSGAVVADNATVIFEPEYPNTEDATFLIRNQGTLDLNLSNLKIAGDAQFTIVAGLNDSVLSVGEKAYFTVRFSPTDAAAHAATVTFDSDDPGDLTHHIVLNGDATVKSISGKLVHDKDGTASITAEDTDWVGGRAYLDLNDNGSYDLSAPTTFNSTDTPLAIPDPGFVASKMTVSGFTGNLGDLDVALDISHTYDSDLDLFLVAPNGSFVVLASANGFDGDNFTSTVFDDQATTSINDGVPPFTGTFKPLTPLGQLEGMSAAEVNGVWQLVAQDNFTPDPGTLNSWSLTLRSTTDLPTISGPDGDYSFFDLVPATYTVRAQPDTGNILTFPASGKASVTLSSATSVEGNVNFGEIPANSIIGRLYDDRDGNGAYGPLDVPRAGATAYLDINNSGSFDVSTSSVSGTTGPIADAYSSGYPYYYTYYGQTTFPVTVSGFTGTLVDIDLTLDITHTWDSDLAAVLIAPTGASITLFNGVGGNGDNFTNTKFDDEAAQSINLGAAPFTGSFQPIVPLSTFDSLTSAQINGTWNLVIIDFAVGDSGFLNSWSLDLTSSPDIVATSSATGYYAFNGLAAGPYVVRSEPGAGYQLTVPASGKYTPTLAGDYVANQDFGRIQPNSIAGRVFEDFNGDGSVAIGDGGLSGRTVWRDDNNNGILDGSTSTTDYTDSPNLPINDSSPNAYTQSVSGFTGTVTDVNVTINLTHTYDSDLNIFITGPTGKTATLSLNRGGGGDNFTNTVFDDEASTSISAGTAPFTGSFKPETLLSVFDGENPNGTWTLNVNDGAGGDFGTLLSWTISVSKQIGESATSTDALGDYTFANQPAGPYNVRTVVPAGWNALSPPGGVHSGTLTLGGAELAKNFGQARQNSIYGNTYNDLDLSNSLNAGDTALPGVFVYDDANGNSAPDIDNWVSTDVPKPVVDLAVSSSTQSVVFPSAVTDLDVKLSIFHTFMADMKLTLIGPTGVSVNLVSNIGGSNDGFVDTVFDDSAATPIASGTYPYTGSFIPASPLSAFNGVSATGKWTLQVEDSVGGDSGTINNWELIFNGGAIADETATTSNAYGNYALTGLTAGNHDVRRVVPSGLFALEPTGDKHSVTLAANATEQNRNFGHTDSPPASPPSISSVKIDSGTGQRSIIQSIVVTFSEPISFVSTADAAFDLDRLVASVSPGPTGAVVLDFNHVGNSVTISFGSDPSMAPAVGSIKSLRDGLYEMKVIANQIKSVGSGLLLNSGVDPAPTDFHRLFGDVRGATTVDLNGNGFTDNVDLVAFRNANGTDTTSPNYDPALDENGDGFIDNFDLLGFRSRIGTQP